MKKIVYGILATISGLVLLFSYRTSLGETSAPVAQIGSGTTTTGAAGTTTSGSAPSSSAAAPSTAASPPSSSSGSAPASTGLKDGTYTGKSANTRYGAVQVQITVSGGKITDVSVPRYPSSNGRDAEINQQALPMLISETLSAQSSKISMISGATYTSDGYLTSLQSAIDQA